MNSSDRSIKVTVMGHERYWSIDKMRLIHWLLNGDAEVEVDLNGYLYTREITNAAFLEFRLQGKGLIPFNRTA